MKAIIRVIDSISEYTGKVASWVCLLVILVLVYEVTARYAFNSPSIWAHQLSMILGLTIIALGWAYTHRHHGHVRVDIIYTYLSPRGKAIIDVVFTLLFLFPLLILITISAADWMMSSWSGGEVLTASVWYPPAGPIRTIMFLGLLLFILQGVAGFVRDSYLLIRNKPYD
ncbi:hypothetical protein ES707_01401 [subsurface metagenome]